MAHGMENQHARTPTPPRVRLFGIVSWRSGKVKPRQRIGNEHLPLRAVQGQTNRARWRAQIRSPLRKAIR